MIGRFSEHWELKLVALVIAVALWLYTNGQVRIERSINVSVTSASVQSLPKGYRVTEIRPDKFTVNLSVPVSQVGGAGLWVCAAAGRTNGATTAGSGRSVRSRARARILSTH